MSIAFDRIWLLLLNVWRGQDKKKGIFINKKFSCRQMVKSSRKPAQWSKGTDEGSSEVT